jgi:aspartyl-tRNA(Asn)/glutamyl-tRNA(Gln) amidotransferase subunit B
VVDGNAAAVADVREGKLQALGFLTGQVMRQTRGQADAATVNALLRELLGLG